MTVHFVGAGPGAPDLITVRGLRLIERCQVCLYAGSLVPEEVVAAAPNGARVIDTAPLHLDQIMAEIETAHAQGFDIARVHSGDPSIYGAIAEQIRRLKALGIPYEITPGVPAFAAAAAAIGQELTLPQIAQTVILTRTAMKASAMPEGEDLETLARSGATLAIHLSARNLPAVQRALIPYYGCRVPRNMRLPRKLARREDHPRNIGDDSGPRTRGKDYKDRVDPDRPGFGGGRFCGQRAL